METPATTEEVRSRPRRQQRLRPTFNLHVTCRLTEEAKERAAQVIADLLAERRGKA